MPTPSARRRPPLVPIALTLALLAAQLVSAPALRDPTGAPLPPGLRLETPGLYLLLAPLFTLWDGVSMLSMSRLRGLLVGLAVLYVAGRALAAVRSRQGAGVRPRRLLREIGWAGAALAVLAAFVLTGALWHRPMLRLAGTPADLVVADFHSHSSVSHDVEDTWMRGFDADAARRWHARAGFDAFFLTDHNEVAERPPVAGDPVPAVCPGIEVSAFRAHVVLLGSPGVVNRDAYSRSLEGLYTLLRTSEERYGARTVASIPEYERHHGHRLDSLVAAGLDGFEVVNAAPKANELSVRRRDSVVALARAADRFIVGVSDHHGWGATSMVWNLVAAPGWRDAPAAVCGRVLAALDDGFEAVQVVERHRLRPDAWWPMWLTPVGVVWETWRAMGWAAAASWLAWIWGVVGVRRMMREADGGGR